MAKIYYGHLEKFLISKTTLLVGKKPRYPWNPLIVKMRTYFAIQESNNIKQLIESRKFKMPNTKRQT